MNSNHTVNYPAFPLLAPLPRPALLLKYIIFLWQSAENNVCFCDSDIASGVKIYASVRFPHVKHNCLISIWKYFPDIRTT